MERNITPLNGITSSSVYEDGDCIDLVNLRKKNGALRPVPQRETVQLLSLEYYIAFVHKNEDYENWIGVTAEPNGSRIFWNIRNDPPALIKFISGETVNSIQQNGNLLIIITSSNIYYALFRDNSYAWLGDFPDIPTFNLSSEAVYFYRDVGFGNVYTSIFTYFYGSDEPGADGTHLFDFTQISDKTQALINHARDIYLHGGTVTIDGTHVNKIDDALFDARIIRYAFRLYDGSYINVSAPVLVMPPYKIDESAVASYYTVWSNSTSTLQLRSWIGSGNPQSVDDVSHIKLQGFKLHVTGFSNLPLNWANIITHVDFFMSPPIGASGVDNIDKDLPKGDTAAMVRVVKSLSEGVTGELLERIKNSGEFFLFKSFPLQAGDYSLDFKFPDSDGDTRTVETLITRERLTETNAFSHHDTGAEGSYMYNRNLHLFDIKTTFFKGFSHRTFLWDSDYNGVHTSPLNIVDRVILEVLIKTDTTVKRAYVSNSIVPRFFHSAFWSYPDPRAIELNVYAAESSLPPGKWAKMASLPLTTHNALPIACYIQPDLLPVAYLEQPDPVRLVDEINPLPPPPSTRQRNLVKVSETDNPLLFPDTRNYFTGDETVLALAANVMPVSDQNYGSHPLFVFATDGVWTLNIGAGDTLYTTMSTPASDEIPISGVVCETPFGVAYISRRGLMRINGSQTEFISPQLEETLPPVTMEFPAQIAGPVLPFPSMTFREYLAGADFMLYNPFESEIIIRRRDTNYSWVLSLSSQTFYRSTEIPSIPVKNVYPNLYTIMSAAGLHALTDYAQPVGAEAHICFTTRPLRFGTDDIKKLDRIIFRGLFYKLNYAVPFPPQKPVFAVWRSDDGDNFILARGLTREPGFVGTDYKDIDTGLLARTKFRYFIAQLGARADERTRIYTLDSIFGKEYDNEKMR
jgi:hypothetical protein